MIFQGLKGWRFECDMCLCRRRVLVRNKRAACHRLTLAGWWVDIDGSAVCPPCLAEMQVAVRAN